ncbi:hypothetical protein P154DRAFT_597094 [Amniculicola lignicola CBS 123094]|uniref:Aminoglycoside phosphotransferase domain-containing protein n=1 Tax=Amniculicola lignicola CBS 123094 TaxID=1392246 RepID=A0A6A5X2A6_9PLEO|nr:hypothetical protein P154DRAFT_597094 [Amniculicola lignicola CBS 123094]
MLMENVPALMRKHYGTTEPGKVKAMREKDSKIWGASFLAPGDTATSLPLPYYAPDKTLPPIPTAQEIEAAAKILANRNRSPPFSGVLVVRVHNVYAVKVGTTMRLFQEADNLVYLQQHPIKTPRVYALFSATGSNPFCDRDDVRARSQSMHYLVTDFLPGLTLDEDEWLQLDASVQTKLFEKLAAEVKLLRSVAPPDPAYYGSVDGRGYRPGMPFTKYRSTDTPGPFYSYEAFIDQVYRTFEVNAIGRLLKHPEDEIFPAMQLYSSIFFSEFGKATPSSREPKLTHMDITMGNIRFVPSAKSGIKHSEASMESLSARVNDYEVWLIDWETLSWLPAWAEVAALMTTLPRRYGGIDDFALSGVGKGIQPFPYSEAIFYQKCCEVFGGLI